MHFVSLPLENPVDIFAVIIFTIFIANILSKFLKIPSIIGLIIFGIFLGPHSLNILDESLAVTIFAKTGLLYIMFLAGFELNLKEFFNNSFKIVIFGALTFVIPFIIGLFVFGYVFGFHVKSAILIATIFSTHTLITYPLIKNYPNKSIVSMIVGGTIVTDTLVLFLLALFTNIQQYSESSIVYILFSLVITFVIFILVIFVVIPYVSRIFFSKFASHKNLVYIFTLLMVLIAAVSSEIMGMDVIIGAFFAGLALSSFAKDIEIVKQEIYFIGNNLFVPVFLISIGMLFDYKIVLQMSYSLTLVFIFIAMFSKWFVAKVIQIIFSLNNDEKAITFGLRSSHAAAALAVVLIGTNIGILDRNILNSTILLILLSCLVSSIVVSKIMKKYD